jgi:hypothetical protein
MQGWRQADKAGPETVWRTGRMFTKLEHEKLAVTDLFITKPTHSI